MERSGAGRGDEAGFSPQPSGFDSRPLQSKEEEKPMSAAHVLPFVLAETPKAEAEITHEAFVQAVRAAVVPRVVSASERARLMAAKLVYGRGQAGVRGLCHFGGWENGSSHDFLEVGALGEESYVQLAGTTVHELAHSLAGHDCGHGKEWKQACAVLGLAVAQAAGQEYAPEHFDPSAWAAIEALPHPSDGKPAFAQSAGAPALPRRPRPCPLGIGTRGGRSRGAGSGSRMRLWLCGCPEGTVGRKVRVASDEWDATCNRCGSRYQKATA
jgi:hypothetical protein